MQAIQVHNGRTPLFRMRPTGCPESVFAEQSFATRIPDGKICNHPFESLLPRVPNQILQKQSAHALRATATNALKLGGDNQRGFRRFASRQPIYRAYPYELSADEGSLGKLLLSFLVPLSLEPGRRFAGRGRKIAAVSQIDRLRIETVLELLHLAAVIFFQRHKVHYQVAKDGPSGVSAPCLPGFEDVR